MSIFIFRSKLFFKTELNILEIKSIRFHIQSEHIESAVKFDLFPDHNILAVSSVKCEVAHRESVENRVHGSWASFSSVELPLRLTSYSPGCSTSRAMT